MTEVCPLYSSMVRTKQDQPEVEEMMTIKSGDE